MACVALWALCSHAQAQNFSALRSSVVRAKLPNGLDVVILPDRDVPNVALTLWYRVGSRNEGPGRTGLSHFFEHMMFNGAKKYGPGEFDRVMEAAGGSNNAFTSSDVTVYQDWFPSSALRLILEMEADRMRGLVLTPEKIESERGVVYSERRTSVDGSPAALLDEQVRAAAFVAHPYGIPTIGWPGDIESWTREDLQRHYETFYAPNNATIVLVGDVDPASALSRMRQTVGRVPRGPALPRVGSTEPPQTGERRVIVKGQGQLSLVELAYRAPAATSEQFPAMELADSILTEGFSSRLWRRLVEEERVAVSVSGSADEGFDPGLYTLHITVSPEATPERVIELATAVIEELRSTGPTEDELSKARRQRLMAHYQAVQTISGMSVALGAYELFRGGADRVFDAESELNEVTAEQVKAVLASFGVDNRTVGIFLPSEDDDAQSP
jgi:zinc protease